jgi:simple sugar transport system permease protein
MAEALGWWGVPLAIAAGTMRGGTPFLFVSLGECLTEKSGKINLGLEGTLLTGAMTAYATSYLTGSPWLGLIVAGLAGMVLGFIHAWLCQQPRVNDVAVGIAMIIFGSGIAFFFGKPFIQPSAPKLPTIDLGGWSSMPALESALQISPLFLLGVAIAPLMLWFFKSTRWGLFIRAVGDSPDAALAMGVSIKQVRMLCIIAGSFLAGLGGASLSLYYPGVWNENISSGQGLMAVALVIFARWNPIQCLYASLLFGGAQALGPALQSVGITQGYYLFNAAPYVLTLAIMIITCSPKRTLTGAPGALGQVTRPILRGAMLETVNFAVNGTLMWGLELNGNLLNVGATFVREAKTEPAYRLWSIDDRHPAMLRVTTGGSAIALEVWRVPVAGLATILLQEPPGIVYR